MSNPRRENKLVRFARLDGADKWLLIRASAWLGVARLLESTQQADAVYAAADGGVWLVSFEGDEPVVTVLASPPVPEPDEGKRRRRRR